MGFLRQKVVFIVGCSNSFGVLTALKCAQAGYCVIATVPDLGKGGKLKDVAKEFPNLIAIEQLNTFDQAAIKKIVTKAVDTYGKIDVLVSDAGYVMAGYFEDLTSEDIHHQLEVNFFGVQNVIREVLPFMRQRRSGRIINISSSSGFVAYPCFGVYNASKWALEGFSESLYYELKPFGIDVLLIQPGSYPMETFTADTKYAEKFDDTNSPYFSYSRFLKDMVIPQINASTKDPQDVAVLITKLIADPNPSFRNIPDFETKRLFWARKWLPFGIFQFLFKTFILGKKLQ